MDSRIENFDNRREELNGLCDEALKQRFWELCNKVVEPIVVLAKNHTSPSIERSVLLRMGIDSVSTHAIVPVINEAGLMGKGAGNIVLKVSAARGCDIRKAGQLIIDDKNILSEIKGG